MKKLKLILFFLSLTSICFSAPSTTINIPNSFSAQTTIQSSPVNANFNEVSTEYNTHTHTDITQVGVITSGTWTGSAIGTAYVASGAGAITGEIRMWSGSSSNIPSGWLLCDGTAVSRVTYSALFAVTSTSFGTGDGSTTFNLPNLSSRFPRGHATLAQTGAGSDTHDHGAATGSTTLTTAQIPAHTHDVTYWAVEGGGSQPANGAGNNSSSTDATASAGGGTGHTHTISSADNIPAYTNVLYIIKT